LTVGSLASYAAEGDTTDAIDATNALVITIDKANTMNGTLDLAYQLDEPMTYVALNGTATANPDITLSVNGTNLDPAIENQLLISENPEGTDTIPYVLTATIDPNTPLGEYQASVNVTATDLRHELNVTFEADSKEYDGNTDAIVRLGEVDVIGGDDEVTVETPEQVTGHFQSKDADDDVPVTIDANGFALTGAQAHLYKLNLVAPTANITPKALTLTDLPALTKVYDGTDSMTDDDFWTILDWINSDSPLDGIANESDEVRIAEQGMAGGYYNSVNVADTTYFPLWLPDLSLEGADAGNYTISDSVDLPASITPKQINALFGSPSISKVYDGNGMLTEANIETLESAFTLSGQLPEDEVYVDATFSGFYNALNVRIASQAVLQATLKLTGPAADNYSIESQWNGTTTASITPRQVWLAADPISKVFDGTTDLTPDNLDALYGFHFEDATGTEVYVGYPNEPWIFTGYYDAATVEDATKATISTNVVLPGDENNTLVSQTFEVKATITPKPLDYTGMGTFAVDWHKPFNGRADTEGIRITYDNFPYSADDGLRALAGVAGGYDDVTLGYDLAAIPAEQELLKRGVGGPDEGCRIETTVVGPEGFNLTGDDASNYSISRVTIDTYCWIEEPAAPTSAPAPLGEQVSTKPLPVVLETPVVEQEKVTDEAVESTEAAVEPTEEAKLDPPVVEGKQEDTDPVTEAKPEDDTDEPDADDDGDLGDGAN
jgi:hypothetical protein